MRPGPAGSLLADFHAGRIEDSECAQQGKTSAIDERSNDFFKNRL